MITNDPQHSHRYAARWKQFAAEGRDLAGEARLIDAMADRGSRILDAGCGTGRVGGQLAQFGHTIVGVDLSRDLPGVKRLALSLPIAKARALRDALRAPIPASVVRG